MQDATRKLPIRSALIAAVLLTNALAFFAGTQWGSSDAEPTFVAFHEQDSRGAHHEADKPEPEVVNVGCCGGIAVGSLREGV